MKIAYVLYPDFTALDLIGPYEIISRWPDADVHFLARSREPVRCDRGLTVIPTDTPATLARSRPDRRSGQREPALSAQGRGVDPLGARRGAGLPVDGVRVQRRRPVRGRRPARRQGHHDSLGLSGQPAGARGRGGRRPSRLAGQPRQRSRGLRRDRHGLGLDERVHGPELAKALQLVIEYDPQPPFDSGSPDKADAGTMRLARRVLLGDHAVQKMAAMGLQLVGARIGRARPFKPKHRSTR
jgi:cyclohexyl-isocyanide hydratase